ncbi:hypothetical protein KBY93_02345 [Synechococcus sp. J7-Johnson]|nr:hypothetical protein [Synechococcus sp. J7-Johnson]
MHKTSHKLGVIFPVLIDNDIAIWKAFNNTYWPVITSSTIRVASAPATLEKVSMPSLSRRFSSLYMKRAIAMCPTVGSGPEAP